MGLELTIALFVATIGVCVFALLRAKKPAEPLKVRLIDYNYVLIVGFVIAMVLGAHLVRLLST